MRVLRADAFLLLVALIWGVGFVVQRTAMETVGPLTFTAARFLVGALVLVPMLVLASRLMPPTPRPAERRHIVLALIGAGVSLALGGAFQQWGLVHTSAGEAGFITGLYVVFVPLLGIMVGYLVRWTVWVAVAVAVVGMWLLSVQGKAHFNVSDLLVLAATIPWAIQVLIVGWLALRLDAATIAVTQTGIAAVLTLVTAVIIEQPSTGPILSLWPELLYSGGLAVGVAFFLQTLGQQDAPPAHTAVLISMEAVFGAIAGWYWLSEQLTGTQLVGCVLMFAAILIAQAKPARSMR